MYLSFKKKQVLEYGVYIKIFYVDNFSPPCIPMCQIYRSLKKIPQNTLNGLRIPIAISCQVVSTYLLTVKNNFFIVHNPNLITPVLNVFRKSSF